MKSKELGAKPPKNFRSQGKDYVIGVCIQSYQDEDDVVDFKCGELDEEDIRVWEVGDKSWIVEGTDNEWWTPLKEKENE